MRTQQSRVRPLSTACKHNADKSRRRQKLRGLKAIKTRALQTTCNVRFGSYRGNGTRRPSLAVVERRSPELKSSSTCRAWRHTKSYGACKASFSFSSLCVDTLAIYPPTPTAKIGKNTWKRHSVDPFNNLWSTKRCASSGKSNDDGQRQPEQRISRTAES